MEPFNITETSVAVVIPNFNYSAFISRLIESLAKQTLKPKRIIFVDDGSTDNSLAIISKQKELYAKQFEQFDIVAMPKNKGKLAALNIGCEMVQEDITLIVDSDDYLAENFLARTLSSLIKENKTNPKIAFVYTDSHLINVDGDILSKGKSFPFDATLLKNTSYIPECAPTFTRVLKEVLPFSENIKIGTKHHKWLRISNNGWIGLHINEALFYYRMHSANISGIGKRILSEVKTTKSDEKILSGYWSPESEGNKHGK